MNHQCLTTIKHLRILKKRHHTPIVEFGDYYAVVVHKPDRDPVAYVAPQSEAAGLTLLELNAAAGVRAEVA